MASRAMPDNDLAVTEARAAKMVGFSVRRLRAWASRSIVTPAVERRLSERNTVRLYRFQDLVELHVARALLDQGRAPQQIRKVVHHLRSRDYEAPLRQFVFAVQGNRIYFSTRTAPGKATECRTRSCFTPSSTWRESGPLSARRSRPIGSGAPGSSFSAVASSAASLCSRALASR